MAVDVLPERRRFTIAEYEKMGQAGILAEDERVELIDGEVVEMSPMGNPHIGAVINLTHLLVRAVADHARVLAQMPIRIPPRSMPEPDLALLRPRSYKREGALPVDVLLVIEVADTSLAYDRVVKQRLYARTGIPEYWIVDTNTETLEGYRAPSGDAYAERRRVVAGETLAPLAFPDCVISIDAIFA